MPDTLCYAECQQCAWAKTDYDDTTTEHAVHDHSSDTGHTVTVHYLGNRK